MVSFQEKVNVLSQRTPFSIYKKLSENFTRCLLELDSIDVKNQTRVRFLNKKKTIVNDVHMVIKNSSAVLIDFRFTDDLIRLYK